MRPKLLFSSCYFPASFHQCVLAHNFLCSSCCKRPKYKLSRTRFPHTLTKIYIPIRVSFHLFHKEIGFNQMAVLQLIWCFLTKLRTVSSVTDSSQKLLAGTLCSVTVNFLLSREASHYKFTRTFYHP